MKQVQQYQMIVNVLTSVVAVIAKQVVSKPLPGIDMGLFEVG